MYFGPCTKQDVQQLREKVLGCKHPESTVNMVSSLSESFAVSRWLTYTQMHIFAAMVDGHIHGYDIP